MATLNNRSAASARSAPIDIIDLTEDSPVNRILRTRRISGNVPSRHGTTMQHRRQLPNRPNVVHPEESITWEMSVEDINDNNDKWDIKEVNIVIDLDNSVSLEENKSYHINDSVSDKSTVLTCPICLESLSSKMKPTSTKCGHIYCAKCLERAIRVTRKCPKCQTSVTLKSCTRLYF